MINELTELNRTMMLSIDIIPVPTDEAVREMQNRLLGVETNVTNWQRRQNSNNNFSAVVPYDLEQQRKETREMLDDLTTRDQRMMFAVVTLVHLADSKEELDSDTETLQSIARKHLCQLNTLNWQQADGLVTALPLGLRRIDALRTLTTEALAVLMPFKAQEIRHQGGVYYGQNAISKNLILANRWELLNANGFVLGVSGSGKSFTAKREIVSLALATGEGISSGDDIIIVDPESEYRPLIEGLGGEVVEISATSPNHINAMDTLDGDRIGRLKAVFWDMTELSSEVESMEHGDSNPNDGVDDSWTETILTITITAKAVDDMRTQYAFTAQQNNTLDELLENLGLLGGLIENLSVTETDAKALLAALPEDLSAERREVLKTACSLVGKVNYFWGGKSLTLGWDSRWGTTMKVTAEGSSTTGTYRPYGLDCSGFVDWVFYNATDGGYVIGHGGGAATQHIYCTSITWNEAIPGDLVFYDDDEHVGIVGGCDENGDLLIIHCASGYNNVVITGLEGFTSIGRPNYYTE